jgi:hypothetical protein
MGKFTKVFKPIAGFSSGVGTGAAIEKTVPEEDKLNTYLGLSGAALAAEQAAKRKRIQKLLAKKLGQKVATLPLKGLAGPAGLGLFAKDIYDIVGPAFSPAMAREMGASSPKEYREFMGGLFSEFKPSEAAKERKEKRVQTKKRMRKEGIPKKNKSLFRPSKKDILKSVGRKKGGKVGRPKGVGCAVRGYGKAMKRGK